MEFPGTVPTPSGSLPIVGPQHAARWALLTASRGGVAAVAVVVWPSGSGAVEACLVAWLVGDKGEKRKRKLQTSLGEVRL